MVLLLVTLGLCALFIWLSSQREELIAGLAGKPDTQAVNVEPDTAAAKPAEPVATPDPLRLDVVRVDPTGGAVIAGRAPAGAVVTVVGNGDPLGDTTAGSDGSFVALIDMPPSDVPVGRSVYGDAN